MAQDLTAAQSDCVSNLRKLAGSIISTLSAGDFLRMKSVSLGGPDAFVPGAFAGANADVTAVQIDAALAGITTLRAQFLDPATGAPTPLMQTLVAIAPVMLP